MFAEELFPSTSLFEMLQTAPDVGMSSYIIHEDDEIALPEILPNLLSQPMSPSDASVNVLDMVSQDMMLENNFACGGAGATTEVTYASQYAASSSSYSMSAAPFTSAGDVFLPSPITTTANTFVKPLHMFVEPPSSSPAAPEPLPMQSPRPDSPTETSKSSRSKKYKHRSDRSGYESRSDHERSSKRSDYKRTKKDDSEKRRDSGQMEIDKSTTRSERSKPADPKTTQQTSKDVLDKNEMQSETKTSDSSHAWNQLTKSRNCSEKTSNKSNKAHTLHSIIKSLSRSLSGKHGAHSKEQTASHEDSPQQQRFLVAAPTHGGKVRSTAVTHTITRPTNIVAESPIAFVSKTVSLTTTTVSLTVSQQDGYVTSSLKTSTVTSHSAIRVHSPMTTGVTCTRTSVTISESVTTSTLTSVSKPRGSISFISPKQGAYVTTSMLYPTPAIISRKVAGGLSPGGPSAVSPSCERVLPAQASFVIPASGSSPTAVEDAARRTRTRYVIPVSLSQYATSSGMALVTTTATVTKPCVAYPMRPTQNVNITNMHTRATTTAAVTTSPSARTLTQSTFTLPPGATLYAARKVPSSRSSGAAPVTTESQTFAFIDRKGMYTTLTISSDLASTAGSSLAPTLTTNTVVAGVSSHTPSVPLDSRLRNQFIIPIANSQMNTSTSLGYLVTSPLGSDIIGARNSAGAGVTQSFTTAAAAIGSHTITTISSDALNRIRNRILIPSASTSLQRHDDPSIDRPRTPVSIIANQLITTPMSNDAPISGILSSQIPTGTRTLFSATGSQGLYAITTPVKSPSPTGAVESASRRVVVQVASNSQNSVATMAAGSITTRALPAIPTPGTYIIATGMASSPTSYSKSSRISLPTVHNATIAKTTTKTATTMSRPFPVVASGSTVSASQMCVTNAHSKVRNQLIVQVSTTASSMPGSTTPITAYTITRSRAPNVYAIPGGSIASTSTTKHADVTTKNPPTMTLITFGTSSATALTTGGAHSTLTATSALCESTPTTTVATTVTTTEGARNRYLFKLNISPSTSVAQSSVTAAVATPITTATLAPSEHRFLEPRQVSSRLRTFPGPRTYSVAERYVVNTLPKPVVRNVCPRVKKCVTPPAPLQIFADVVCPPTTLQSHGALTSGQLKPRFTLSQGACTSVAAAQCKGAVLRKVLTVPHNTPERTGTRVLGPRVVTERVTMIRPSPRLVRPAFTMARSALPRFAGSPAPSASSAPASTGPVDWTVPSSTRHGDTKQ